ncbi:hypothetical protein M758_UG028900 [Ceratodon purpureus]|nr:hypothetical protein M758_UG028900 [Ceratodon purpureus]
MQPASPSHCCRSQQSPVDGSSLSKQLPPNFPSTFQQASFHRNLSYHREHRRLFNHRRKHHQFAYQQPEIAITTNQQPAFPSLVLQPQFFLIAAFTQIFRASHNSAPEPQKCALHNIIHLMPSLQLRIHRSDQQ